MIHLLTAKAEDDIAVLDAEGYGLIGLQPDADRSENRLDMDQRLMQVTVFAERGFVIAHYFELVCWLEEEMRFMRSWIATLISAMTEQRF